MADNIVTNIIMSRLAAPDTLLGVLRMDIFFLQIGLLKNTNSFYYILPVDILNLKKCNYVFKIAWFLSYH